MKLLVFLLLLIISGLIIFIILQPVKEDVIYEKGFQEGVNTAARTIAHIQDHEKIREDSFNIILLQLHYKDSIILSFK